MAKECIKNVIQVESYRGIDEGAIVMMEKGETPQSGMSPIPGMLSKLLNNFYKLGVTPTGIKDCKHLTDSYLYNVCLTIHNADAHEICEVLAKYMQKKKYKNISLSVTDQETFPADIYFIISFSSKSQDIRNHSETQTTITSEESNQYSIEFLLDLFNMVNEVDNFNRKLEKLIKKINSRKKRKNKNVKITPCKGCKSVGSCDDCKVVKGIVDSLKLLRNRNFSMAELE